MRPWMLLGLAALAGCQGDWRARAMADAESLVRDQVGDPSLQFAHVQYTGDDRTGQTCGYYVRQTPDGGQSSTRFIVYIDGGGGQNPYIDDPSAPYPTNKDEFDFDWSSQCLDLGYKDV